MSNILEKIVKLRSRLGKTKLKKSGRNKFAGYDYFELQDFIPTVIELEKELKLFSMFTMEEEKAVLAVYDTETEKSVIFETPRADAQGKGQLPIQALGSQHTYLRRYLYINYLNLNESDGVDNLPDDKKVKEEKKITEVQMAEIRSLYDKRIPDMLKHYKLEKLDDMTEKRAKQLIALEKKAQAEKKSLDDL